MAKSKKPEPTIIAREEWDMALLCPPDQLRLCWLYEFTREYVRQGNSLRRAILVKFPSEFRELLKNAEWLEHKSYLLTIGIRPQLEGATFPQSSEVILELIARYHYSVRLPWNNSSEDVTPLMINWDKGNPELVDSFKNLIENIRPRKPKGVRKKNRLGKYKADLKKLGAFRLLAAGYSQPEARIYTISERNIAAGIEDQNPLYKQKGEWSDAKKAVESIIEKWPNPPR